MNTTTQLKPYLAALGTALSLSLAAPTTAAANPFAATDLGSGYMVASISEAKCGEAKCGNNARLVRPAPVVAEADSMGTGMPTGDMTKTSGDMPMGDAKPKAKDGQCAANKPAPKPKAKDGQCASNK